MWRNDEDRKPRLDYSLKGPIAVLTAAVTAKAMFSTTDYSKAYTNDPNLHLRHCSDVRCNRYKAVTWYSRIWRPSTTFGMKLSYCHDLIPSNYSYNFTASNCYL
jgi:hypothetical protein